MLKYLLHLKSNEIFMFPLQSLCLVHGLIVNLYFFCLFLAFLLVCYEKRLLQRRGQDVKLRVNGETSVHFFIYCNYLRVNEFKVRIVSRHQYTEFGHFTLCFPQDERFRYLHLCYLSRVRCAHREYIDRSLV